MAAAQDMATQMVPSAGTIPLNCDITESAKRPPEKQTCSHSGVETLCIDT